MAFYNFEEGKKRVEEILKIMRKLKKKMFLKTIVNLHIVMVLNHGLDLFS